MSEVKPREFWATQLLGSEDGNYIMSVDKEFILKMATVETEFKVIEYSDYEKLKAENNRLQEQIVYTVDAIKEDMNENSETITKLTRQRDTMRKALEFYADETNIEITHPFDSDFDDDIFLTEVNEKSEPEDYGSRASKALQEAEQE